MNNVTSATITGRLGSGSLVKAFLEADIIDSTKLADDSVNSEHYVDASIDHQHLSNDCIDGDNIQDDVINSEHYAAGSVDHEHLAADAVDGDNIADDSINSEHYVDGSVDHQHLSNDCIDGDNIQDDVINSEHYAAGSVDHEHLANDVIDGDNIQDDVVNSEHIAAGAVDLEHMSSESVDEDNLKISNAGSNGQYLQKQSGNAGGLTWAAVDFSPYAPLAAPALTGNATAVNLTLSGNLTVNGTTTTVATTNTTITDNLIELNSGAGSNANDAGILIERGSTGDNAIIAWDESADKFTVGTTTATNDATGNISITTGTIVANVEGNVTGNVTGNTSGSSGSCTGTASLATSVTASANNSTNETVYPTFVDGTTGSQGIETDSGLTYNPSTGVLTTTSVTGNLTGNVTGNCSGSSGSCTGNAASADTIDVTASGGAAVRYLTFIHSTPDGSAQTLYADGGNDLTYNPGTNTLTSPIISDSKGNVRSIPNNHTTSAYTLVVGDAGKCVTNTTGGVTVNTSIFSAGDAVTIINHSGSDITITQGSSMTIYNTADAATGNRTLAGRGMATLYFTANNIAYISGAGLS